MPEMNCLIALEKMMEINPDAKIIVISAQSYKSTALKALEKGAFNFIDKSNFRSIFNTFYINLFRFINNNFLVSSYFYN